MRIALLQPGWDAGLKYHQPYITVTGDLRWGDAEYVLNPTSGSFDGMVASQAFRPLERTFTVECPPSRTLLVVKEPPDVLALPRGFTDQFAHVISQDPRIRGPRRVLSHSAHHWFVAVPYTQALEPFTGRKTKLISSVTSSKADTLGHRQRLRFLAAVKEHFGDSFDWFGQGIREIQYKSAGLLDHKYHLCLENARHPHYWTEKLVDAYMCNCVPIYWGAPNITDYFDPGSLVQIDIHDIPASIARIKRVIEEDLYSCIQEKLAAARRLILQDYHPYEVYAQTLRSLPFSEPARITIRPHTECSFTFRQRMGLRLSRAATRLRAGVGSVT